MSTIVKKKFLARIAGLTNEETRDALNILTMNLTTGKVTVIKDLEDAIDNSTPIKEDDESRKNKVKAKGKKSKKKLRAEGDDSDNERPSPTHKHRKADSKLSTYTSPSDDSSDGDSPVSTPELNKKQGQNEAQSKASVSEPDQDDGINSERSVSLAGKKSKKSKKNGKTSEKSTSRPIDFTDGSGNDQARRRSEKQETNRKHNATGNNKSQKLRRKNKFMPNRRNAEEPKVASRRDAHPTTKVHTITKRLGAASNTRVSHAGGASDGQTPHRSAEHGTIPVATHNLMGPARPAIRTIQPRAPSMSGHQQSSQQHSAARYSNPQQRKGLPSYPPQNGQRPFDQNQNARRQNARPQNNRQQKGQPQSIQQRRETATSSQKRSGQKRDLRHTEADTPTRQAKKARTEATSGQFAASSLGQLPLTPESCRSSSRDGLPKHIRFHSETPPMHEIPAWTPPGTSGGYTCGHSSQTADPNLKNEEGLVSNAQGYSSSATLLRNNPFEHNAQPSSSASSSRSYAIAAAKARVSGLQADRICLRPQLLCDTC